MGKLNLHLFAYFSRAFPLRGLDYMEIRIRKSAINET